MKDVSVDFRTLWVVNLFRKPARAAIRQSAEASKSSQKKSEASEGSHKKIYRTPAQRVYRGVSRTHGKK